MNLILRIFFLVLLVAIIVAGALGYGWLGNHTAIHEYKDVYEIMALVGGIALSYLRYRRSLGKFESLAAQLGFQIKFEEVQAGREENTWWRATEASRTHPCIEGRHAGRDVAICFRKLKLEWGGGSRHLTMVASATPAKQFVLRLRSVLDTHSMAAPEALRRVEFNDELFRNTFLVETNDEAKARAMLTAETREALLSTRFRRQWREITIAELAKFSGKEELLRLRLRNPLVLTIGDGEACMGFPASIKTSRKIDALAERMDLLCRLAGQAERA